MNRGRLYFAYLIYLCLCVSTLHANIICKPSPQSDVEEPEDADKPIDRANGPGYARPKQKTFIRNPNYISINKKLDNLAQNMYIVELPLPHPGAKGGSSHGCDQFDIVENFRTSRRKSPLG
ncbi:uncharacterized protein LOC111604894 [Drosophila hydei]|uniref:Uncharacterized protein LOC111604894 n=1 Tax=Drosophila hydei TaxID=7224 RepID=A0A6J1MC33_DROHY|nr:uncharacterized protein LOC111604894 [Drosophila hydei]